MLTKHRRGVYAVLSALAIALTGTSLALAAAAPPTATTLAATNITATTATLNGIVDPNKTTTGYFFRYGTSTAYDHVTTPPGMANGGHAKNVSANVSGLTPATTYHFRIFATSPAGKAQGTDMTFKTLAGPGPGPGPGPNKNAVSISSIPHTITWGRTATIAGSVTGPKKAGDLVTLLYSPYPYKPFKPTGKTTTTSTTGAYAFTVRPGVNTRYKVLVATKVPVTSSATQVNVRVKVIIHVSTLHPFRGQRVRFFGTVTPVHNGRYAQIQRRSSTGAWVTVTSTKLVAGGLVHGVLVSRYSTKIKIRRSGTYRVRVNPRDGNHRTGTSAKRTELVH